VQEDRHRGLHSRQLRRIKVAANAQHGLSQQRWSYPGDALAMRWTFHQFTGLAGAGEMPVKWR
jgi:hypothetical protein